MAVHFFAVSGVLFMALMVTQAHVSRQNDAVTDESKKVIMNAMEILLHKQEKLEKKIGVMSEKIVSVSANVDTIEVKPQNKDTGVDNVVKDLKNNMNSVMKDVKTIGRFHDDYLEGKLKKDVEQLLQDTRKLG